MTRWGSEGPPPEAYSRVSEPERFRPLHNVALRLLEQLRTEFKFPTCGCDACDETANDEATRLAELVDDVTAGRFREKLSVPLAGNGWQESESWSVRHRHLSRSQIDRARAREMLAVDGRSSIEWAPWPRYETSG